jgi:hypothetical protein
MKFGVVYNAAVVQRRAGGLLQAVDNETFDVA